MIRTMTPFMNPRKYSGILSYKDRTSASNKIKRRRIRLCIIENLKICNFMSRQFLKHLHRHTPMHTHTQTIYLWLSSWTSEGT